MLTLSESEMVGAKIEEILRMLKQKATGDRLLTFRHAADMLDCSVDYVRKLVELGELEKVDIARDSQLPMWRIPESQVYAYIDRVKART